MSAPQFTITYTDGTVETVPRRPVHIMRAEIILPDSAGPNMVVLATLWAAATGGRGTSAEFEDWVETVDDWERVEADAAPLDEGQPTSPG